jgi:hypothetical protein
MYAVSFIDESSVFACARKEDIYDGRGPRRKR